MEILLERVRNSYLRRTPVAFTVLHRTSEMECKYRLSRYTWPPLGKLLFGKFGARLMKPVVGMN